MTTLARIRTTFSGVAGTPWYSNMYFDADGTSGADYAAYVGEFWTALEPLMTNLVQWSVEPSYSVIEDTTGLTVDVGTWAGADGAGDSPVEPLPYANQGLINWNTGVFLSGRQVRGKTFCPAFTQDSNDSGLILNTFVATIQAAADELLSDGNATLRVYSPTKLTSVVVSGAAVSNRFAVLRSRRD